MVFPPDTDTPGFENENKMKVNENKINASACNRLIPVTDIIINISLIVHSQYMADLCIKDHALAYPVLALAVHGIPLPFDWSHLV